MAFPRIKGASIYANGRKVGQIVSAQFKRISGDEPQFGDGELVGFSDGVTTTTLTCKGIIPVAGMDFDFEDALDNKRDLEMSIATIGGKVFQVTMRCLSEGYDIDNKTGTVNGDLEFSGGKARRV